MGVYMDANSYSQYWQNETIKLIDNQRWIAGRAFGMLKPIALIVDIAKNIFLSLKNIFSLSNSRKHLKLTLLFALDMFNSPIINLIDPNIYTIQITQFNKEKSELQDQIQNLTKLASDEALKNSEIAAQLQKVNERLDVQLNEEKSNLQNQIQNLTKLASDEALKNSEIAAQLQKVNETSMRLVAENTQLNEERLNLQNQIQDLTESTRDGALKNSELAAQLQKVNDTWKLQVADLTEQLQGVNETCQKQYETYDRQLAQLAEEKSSLEKQIATLTKSKIDEANCGILVETSDCGTPQETSSAASLLQTSSSLCQASSSIDQTSSSLVQASSSLEQASSSLGKETATDNELYLEYNLVREKSDGSALQKLKDEADKDNAQAQYHLGQLFWRGEGVKQDPTLAKQYLEAAAEQGHLWACFFLGCFLEGLGTPENETRALELYKELPKGGTPFLTQLFSMDRSLWPKGASSVFDLFEIDQMVQVAEYYAEGELCTEVQLKLARIYENGTKVPQNITEAIKWYKKAAELDSLEAMLALAKIFENGEGEVPQDRAESIKWFIVVKEKASYARDDIRSEAIVALARVYLMKDDFDAYSALTEDYRPRATLPSQRREKVENLLLGISNCESKEYLVELGRNHEIEKNNIAKAIRFYKKARDLGSVKASNELKRLDCL